MGNIISISTGLAYKLTDDRNAMIETIRQFNPQGIELNFYCPEVLYRFEISSQNINYLQSLEYVSIHAPWKDIRYGHNKLCLELLEKIALLYQKTGAQNVTLHPSDVDDYSVFENCGFNLSIENEDWKKPAFKTPAEIEEILNHHPNLYLTFDFAHALTVDPEYIDQFIKIDRISQIHLSYHNHSLRDHHFISRHLFPDIIEKIKLLPNKPLVLESVAVDGSELEFIRDDIETIRKI